MGLDNEVPDELSRVGAFGDQLPDLSLVRLPAPVLKVLPHLALSRAGCECIPLECCGRGCQRLPGSWGPAGVALTYAWTAGGRTVGTGPTLRVTNALAGQRVGTVYPSPAMRCDPGDLTYPVLRA